MKNYNTPKNQITRRTLLIAYATAFTVACTASLPRSVHAADDVTPPPVPSTLQVPAGNTAFLKGFAVGTQNYICLSSGAGIAWTFFGPQATLFDDDEKQITTHFLSANPDENGTPRPTWQHSKDTSTVWARVAPFSTPVVVTPGAIPWLLLEVVGDQDGPTGGHKLTAATFIHRVNTTGGVAPSTGCTLSTDVGKKVLVPYTTDYFFYEAADGDDD
jgi:photosystem II stability/assembly factor-like uncharacterized protein